MYEQMTLEQCIRPKRKTLESLLRNEDDGTLVAIAQELLSDTIPATSYTHGYIRRINRMIDKGELCINSTTYRKVYTPTLAKAVYKELAARHVNYIMNMKGANEAV